MRPIRGHVSSAMTMMHRLEAGPDDRHEDGDESSGGMASSAVDDPRDDLVDPAAVVARQDAQGRADDDAHRDGAEADDERGPRAPDEAREHVVADRVRAEEVGRARWLADRRGGRASVGSYGAIQGAKTASTIMTARIADADEREAVAQEAPQ